MTHFNFSFHNRNSFWILWSSWFNVEQNRKFIFFRIQVFNDSANSIQGTSNSIDSEFIRLSFIIFLLNRRSSLFSSYRWKSFLLNLFSFKLRLITTIHHHPIKNWDLFGDQNIDIIESFWWCSNIFELINSMIRAKHDNLFQWVLVDNPLSVCNDWSSKLRIVVQFFHLRSVWTTTLDFKWTHQINKLITLMIKLKHSRIRSVFRCNDCIALCRQTL